MAEQRASYEAPRVVEYGDISEVTKGLNLFESLDLPLGVDIGIIGTDEELPTS